MNTRRLEMSIKIKDWCDKHPGTTEFDKLTSPYDKYMFVIVKATNYHCQFVRLAVAIGRAIDNADAHKKTGYRVWKGAKLYIAN